MRGMAKAVGVKQLKSRLSEYLRLVKAGETVFITDRDEIVAELRPARRQTRAVETLEDVLDALAETGDITRASAPREGWTGRIPGLGLPSGTAAALLDDLRAERDAARRAERDAAR
jgi:antitoxin (DNA-binding transcriptional repressor) of toxin-antitoxin stability system